MYTLLWQPLRAQTRCPPTVQCKTKACPFCALDRSDSDLVQALRRDGSPPCLGSLSVVGKVGGSCRVAAEEPLSPMNGSSLDGWCSESARARVSVALVVSSNPCWSGLGEVAIVARALKCKGVSSFQALSGDVFPGGGNDAGKHVQEPGQDRRSRPRSRKSAS